MSRRSTSSGDAPLLAWGEELRARRGLAKHRRKLLLGCAGAGAVTMLVCATMMTDPDPRLVWNASASAPLGLYLVRPGAHVKKGQMVIARLPFFYRIMAAQRRYLPERVPLVKRIAAGPGDRVCARADTITVNGTVVAKRLAADAHQRSMPWWNGCTLLQEGQVFLLMAEHSGSFDGRYFGVSEKRDIVGPARLILPASSLSFSSVWR